MRSLKRKSAAPSATPGSASGQIINGDFEAAQTGWDEASQNGWPLIINNAEISPDTVLARSGEWAAWLGGDHNEIAYIEQQVTIPSNAPYFTYWYWFVSREKTCGNDRGGVLLNNITVVERYELCSSNNTNGWQARSIDLSAFAGQTVLIQIRVETNGSLLSHLFVDDVAFLSSPASAAQSNQVTPSESDVMRKLDVISQGHPASNFSPLLREE